MTETNLLYNELTRKIIGAAMEVHKTLGSGFLESVYEEALAIEFDIRKVSYERQKGIEVLYKDILSILVKILKNHCEIICGLERKGTNEDL